MKKIFIFLLICLMMIPFVGAQAAEGSPSADIPSVFIRVSPRVPFSLLQGNEDGILSEDIVFMILQWYYPRVKFNRFHLDEILILNLEHAYQEVSWNFIIQYRPSNSVYALFVNEEGTMAVRKGVISQDSWVTFDFSGLDLGQEIMYVVSNY